MIDNLEQFDKLLGNYTFSPSKIQIYTKGPFKVLKCKKYTFGPCVMF